MDIRKLKTFIRVVEAGNFSRAEEATYTSRQALKKQVDALEENLEFKLFLRDSKGVSLTPAGREFYNGVLNVLSDWEDLVNHCRGIASNASLIRIANPAHPHLILEPVFLEFSKKHPEIRQEFVFLDKEEMVDAVLGGVVDIAEMVPPRKMDLEKLGYRKLTDMHYRCLMAASNPLAAREELLPEDLSGCYVGVRGHGNMDLTRLLRERCENLTLVETMGSETQNMFRFCYNNGIYISRAPFFDQLQSLIAVPLRTGIVSECGIIYSKEHSYILDRFLGVVDEVFPLETRE